MKTLIKLSMLSLALMASAQACAMNEEAREMTVQEAYEYLCPYFSTNYTGEQRGIDALRLYDVSLAYNECVLGMENNKEVLTTAFTAAKLLEGMIKSNAAPKNTYLHAKIAAGCITAASLIGLTTYIFRNQLHSLFDVRIKPVINPIFRYITSKTPNFIKNIWSK
jgi:hypothetical protein